MAKLNVFRVYIYDPGGLENCHSLAKNNFVRVTYWKCGAECVVAHRMWRLVQNVT